MAMIYALENTINGFAYIGVTSGKLSKRLREHRCLCRNHKHHAAKLTEDWHKYSEEAFVIRKLEDAVYHHRGAFCEAEQKWITHYDLLGKLYNARNIANTFTQEEMRRGVEASRTSTGNRWTPEANEKRRLSQLGIPKGHGAKISATKQAKKLLMR